MLGDELVPIYQQLEYHVIADIVRRVAKTGRLTETAEIMVETLRDKGYSPTAIQHQVMRVLGANKGFQREIETNTIACKKAIQAEIETARTLLDDSGPDMWEETGNMAFHADLSVWQSDRKPVQDSSFSVLVGAMQKRMSGELKSLTKSMGFRLPSGGFVKVADAYTRMLNLALVKTTSGAYSYQQAIEECARDLARSGLRTVDYESGRSYQLDTAVRNAVMTASSQLAGEITMHNMEQTGAEYVEVSAHWGARTGEGHANHAGWQGKVYKVDGSDGVYGNLEQETGYPSDPAGLHGYNCRHTFYPFWPGLSEPNTWPPEPGPKEWNGRTYDYYAATQEQRRREREIRALKREQNAAKAAGLDSKAKQLGGLIKTKTGEYIDFSDAMEISPKRNRLRVHGALTGNKNSGILNLLDVSIMRSVGAKATNYDIVDHNTGRIFRYAEGTYVRNVQVFAGYGTKTNLHDGVAEGLTAEYGGNVNKWQHVKGIGEIDDDGEIVRAEVHWFQEESIGQVKHKIKRWID